MMSEGGGSHFLAAIERLDGGHVIEVADDKLREVLAAVHRTGKKGSLTLTLTVDQNGEMGFAASAKLTAKAPEMDFGQSFFFLGKDGDLTREAPNMRQMGLFTPLNKERSDG
jgi:hypothetical protein